MAGDLIRLLCPNLSCKAILSVPPTARGKSVQCRQCGMRIKIPAGAGKSKPAPAAASPSTPDAGQAPQAPKS